MRARRQSLHRRPKTLEWGQARGADIVSVCLKEVTTTCVYGLSTDPRRHVCANVGPTLLCSDFKLLRSFRSESCGGRRE